MAKQSNLNFISSTTFLFLLTSIYLYFIYALTRNNLWLEIAVSIVFPATFFVLNKAPHFKTRVKQLFYIESSFNILAILSMTAIILSIEFGHTLLAIGFVVFFITQILGFVFYQIKRKKFTSVFLTLVLFGFILSWFFSLNNDFYSIMDSQGRFLMWGVDAPLSVKIMYTIWALNPMFVDSKFLPKITQATVHIPSIVLSWWSGEFFHIRLLTACHLFMLDGIIGYAKPEFLGRNFCYIPKHYQLFFTKTVQPTIQYGGVLIAIALIISSWIWGLNLG